MILDDRDARATGAGSNEPLGSSDGGGDTKGRTVDRASGNRRVRNRVEAWRYVLEMWEDAELRPDEAEDASDVMEAERPRACARVSAAVYEVWFEAIVGFAEEESCVGVSCGRFRSSSSM